MSDRLITWATIEGASSADPPACAALVMLTSATNRAATAPTDAANGGSCRARADRINVPTPYATTASVAASDVSAHAPGDARENENATRAAATTPPA